MATDNSHEARDAIARHVAAAAVLVSVLSLPWFWWRTPEIQMTFRPWIRGLREYTSSWTIIDKTLRDIPIDGNFAIRFVNFDRNNPSHTNAAAAWCNRGTYILYPRRIFVAEERAVIGNGRDVVDAQFDPSMVWLQQNRVRVLITMTVTGPEQFSAVFTEIPPGEGNR